MTEMFIASRKNIDALLDDLLKVSEMEMDRGQFFRLMQRSYLAATALEVPGRSAAELFGCCELVGVELLANSWFMRSFALGVTPDEHIPGPEKAVRIARRVYRYLRAAVERHVVYLGVMEALTTAGLK